MSPENPPPVDPADMPLLMTLEQLRNPAPKNTNVSFLRRTQYISAATRAPDSAKPAPVSIKPRAQDKTKASRDDPTYIKKYIQKGFDIAYPQSKHTGEDTTSRIRGHVASKPETDAWARPVHPSNPKLKPVGFYPLLPDLQGFPDPGGFVQFKFDKAPVQAVNRKRDERMDSAILLPSAPEERVIQAHTTKATLHKTNPNLYPDPGPVPWDYDLFLPEKVNSAKHVAASLKISNPDRDSKEYYTHEGSDGAKFHRYDRVRTYATSSQNLSVDQKQRDVALALYDPAEAEGDESLSKQKGAYYYPILGKTRLKPERARTIAQAGLAPTRPKTKEDQVAQMQVVVRDPDQAEVYKRSLHRAAIDPKFAESMPPPPEEPENNEESAREEQHEQPAGEQAEENENSRSREQSAEDQQQDADEEE